MKLRQLSESDLEHIMVLYKEQYAFHEEIDAKYFVPPNNETLMVIREYLQNCFEKNKLDLLGAFNENGEIVGLISYKYEKNPQIDTHVKEYGFIYELIVSDRFRSKGVGKKLLNWVEDNVFRPMGVKYMKLCTSSFNTKAQKFYERENYYNCISTFIKEL